MTLSGAINTQLHIITADNGGYSNRKPAERRIWSGTLPHGEFGAAHCRLPRLTMSGKRDILHLY